MDLIFISKRQGRSDQKGGTIVPTIRKGGLARSGNLTSSTILILPNYNKSNKHKETVIIETEIDKNVSSNFKAK